MDAVSKRQLVLAIFVVLQSWKLYEWIFDIPNGFELLDSLLAFFFKWATIELLFVSAVHFFRIPKLTFSLPTRMLLFGILMCFNVGLIVVGPLASFWLAPIAKIPSQPASLDVSSILIPLKSGIVDDIAGSKDALLKDSLNHIGGEYTVKVRPWALAKLNPDSAPLCIPTSTPPPNSHGLGESTKRPLLVEAIPAALIPLQLTGVGPWAVAWEYAASQHLLSMEHRNVEVFTDRHSVVKAAKAGYYRISSIVDGNGAEGKIVKPEPLFVDACPEARIDGYALKSGVDLCTKSSFPLKIWLAGAGPFDVALVKYSGKSSKHLLLRDLRPDPDDKLIEGINKSGKFRLVNVPLSDFNSTGEHLVRIESISDSRGLERKYGEWDMGDAVVVHAFDPPSVSWSFDQARPPLLKEKQVFTNVSVALTGHKPFSLTFQIAEISDPQHVVETKTIGAIETNLVQIAATRPGIYRLLSISDAICEGKPRAPEEVTVALAHPPSLNVGFNPVKSSCQGDLGAIFELEFSGSGPWRLEYKETQIGGGQKPKTRFLSSQSQKLTYKWIPEVPGVFLIQFMTLSDANYQRTPLSMKPYQVEILPMPNAVIVSPKPDPSGQVFACLGTSLSVQMKLTGVGPWRVEASYTKPDGMVQKVDIKVSTATHIYNHKLPTFETGGRHVFQFVSVVDDNGCSKTIEDQVIHIQVLSNLPTASFLEGKTELRIRENGVGTIPLELTGNKGPWTIELQRSFAGKSTVEQRVVENPAKGLTLSHEGEYSMLSVKDLYCVGNVLSSSKAIVNVIKSPKVSFSKSIEGCSCRCSPSPLNHAILDVSGGSGSVVIRYHEQFSHDLQGISSKKPVEKHVTLIAVPEGLARVQLAIPNHRQPGFYKFQLLSVSDDVYSNVDLQMKPNSSFLQTVLPDPTPRIIDDTIILHCLSETNQRTAIKLEFTGSAIEGSGPWSVTFDLVHDDPKAPATLSMFGLTQVVPKSPGELVVEGLRVAGNFHVTIKKVADHHGCIWEAPSLSLDKAVISGFSIPLHVISAPTISRLLPFPEDTHSCVGDVAKFELGGTGPWSISYSLLKPDGTELIHKTDLVKTPAFTVLLAESGSLRIDSVSNQKCVIRDPKVLPGPVIVKALPSAMIDPGMQIVREGEAAVFKVHLKGEAPFEFTYQRLDENAKEVVLDTKTVSNVKASEYLVDVDVGGTFRIENVKDKFCQYPRHRNV